MDNVVFKNGGTTRMTTSNRFDNLNRLTTKSSQPSAPGLSPIAFSYTYNAANQRTAVTNADSSRWSYGYDSLGQVASGKRYWGDGTVVAGQQFEYGFDDIGNRKTAASGGDEWGANLRYENYTANTLNQYSSRTVPGAMDVLGAAHSNATVTVQGSAGGPPAVPGDPPGTFRTTRKGEYYRGEIFFNNSTGLVWLSITNLAVLPNGTNADITTTNTGQWLAAQTPESFAYDLDGNLTRDGLWTNTWNAENRWIEATNLSTVPVIARRKVEFAYDGQGRRIQKIVSTNSGSAWVPQFTNCFVYDGWNLLAELNGPDQSVLRSYLWGLDLSGTPQGAGGVGGLLAVNAQSNGVHFCAMDGNGNVSALVSATNTSVTAKYDYSPFGQVLVADGPMARRQPFCFSTKYHDEETRTLYYGLRDYTPDAGRWQSRDPIGELGQLWVNNQSKTQYKINPGDYVFVGNRPARRIDRLGLDWVEDENGYYIPPPNSACDSFNAWFEQEKKDMSWMNGLPSCPCRLVFVCRFIRLRPQNPNPSVWNNPSGLDVHQGAEWCIRSHTIGSGARNQCCYDRNGILITHGSGAGTVDRSGGVGHVTQDYIPYTWALSCDRGTPGLHVAKYLEVRPIENGNNCRQNP
jgi:RHS repeat-associated protein